MRSTIRGLLGLAVAITAVQAAEIVATVTSSDGTIYDHKSCWTKGSSTTFDALSDDATASSTMTVQKCANYCSDYKYFGVSNGRECYCGDSLAGSALQPASCNVACKGAPGEFCGGATSLNVYERAHALDIVPSSGEFEYQTCWTDGGSASHALTDTGFSSTKMTVPKCAAFCDGYTYFGVSNGNKCYCGDEINQATQEAENQNECNSPCTGASTTACGGANRVNLYKIPIASLPSSTTTSVASSTAASTASSTEVVSSTEAEAASSTQAASTTTDVSSTITSAASLSVAPSTTDSSTATPTSSALPEDDECDDYDDEDDEDDDDDEDCDDDEDPEPSSTVSTTSSTSTVASSTDSASSSALVSSDVASSATASSSASDVASSTASSSAVSSDVLSSTISSSDVASSTASSSAVSSEAPSSTVSSSDVASSTASSSAVSSDVASSTSVTPSSSGASSSVPPSSSVESSSSEIISSTTSSAPAASSTAAETCIDCSVPVVRDNKFQSGNTPQPGYIWGPEFSQNWVRESFPYQYAVEGNTQEVRTDAVGGFNYVYNTCEGGKTWTCRGHYAQRVSVKAGVVYKLFTEYKLAGVPADDESSLLHFSGLKLGQSATLFDFSFSPLDNTNNVWATWTTDGWTAPEDAEIILHFQWEIPHSNSVMEIKEANMYAVACRDPGSTLTCPSTGASSTASVVVSTTEVISSTAASSVASATDAVSSTTEVVSSTAASSSVASSTEAVVSSSTTSSSAEPSTTSTTSTTSSSTTSTTSSSTTSTTSSTTSSATPTATPNPFPDVFTYTWQGCFEEIPGRLFKGKESATDTMTLEECATFCHSFPYFGVEYGRECFCGSDPVASGGQLASSITQCNMPCAGNSTEICGAGNRLSVYHDPAKLGPSTGGSNLGSTKKGCYTETNAGRTLAAKGFGDDNLTLETCAVGCAGYKYWGVEYGRECFCGNTIQQAAQLVGDAECNMVCAGNAGELCGAGNRIMVYERVMD